MKKVILGVLCLMVTMSLAFAVTAKEVTKEKGAVVTDQGVGTFKSETVTKKSGEVKTKDAVTVKTEDTTVKVKAKEVTKPTETGTKSKETATVTVKDKGSNEQVVKILSYSENDPNNSNDDTVTFITGKGVQRKMRIHQNYMQNNKNVNQLTGKTVKIYSTRPIDAKDYEGIVTKMQEDKPVDIK